MSLVLVVVVLFFTITYKVVREEYEGFETTSSFKSLSSDVPPVQVTLFLVLPPLLSFLVPRISCLGPGNGQRKLGFWHL